MPITRIPPQTRTRAKKLRREMTPPERMLWSHLKKLKSHNIHFRRQAPIGPYIADFACLAQKLIIELDGKTHDGELAAARDARRTAFLQSQGFTVLRFSNQLAVSGTESIVETILAEVKNDGS